MTPKRHWFRNLKWHRNSVRCKTIISDWLWNVFLLRKSFSKPTSMSCPMNMEARNQYLKDLRSEYLKTKSKKERSKILNEAEKRTGLERKYLIKKFRPKSNLDKQPANRKKRKQYYDGAVKTALVQIQISFPLAGNSFRQRHGVYQCSLV